MLHNYYRVAFVEESFWHLLKGDFAAHIRCSREKGSKMPRIPAEHKTGETCANLLTFNLVCDNKGYKSNQFRSEPKTSK